LRQRATAERTASRWSQSLGRRTRSTSFGFGQQGGLDVFYGTAESLPPEVKCRQYDMIVMNHVLEHTRDPLLALRNAMQLLVDGGKLVMEVPNNSCIGLKSSGIAWLHLDVPRHLYFFTPQSFRAICEKVGFEIISTEFNGYYRQFVTV
jgi:SAM-dependent methyltransferase